MCEFKTWLLLTYDLATGGRSCLGVVSCPFRPNERSPMFSISRTHKQAWVEFSKLGNREVRIVFNKEKVIVRVSYDSVG